jgi:hypothetical protein
MENDLMWIVERLPAFLLGAGCASLVIAALLEARRERARAMDLTIHRKGADGDWAEVQRRRVAEGAR